MRLKEEQRLAIEHGEGDLLVSASAGSGKTFVMINRAIRLILEGKARLSELLAVTFTEKAADEMKEKLMRAMIAAVNEGDEELREQLADLPSASVSTLHAFCANLLRNYFFAAGLDADFQIADNVAAEELRTRAMDEVFLRKYEQKDEAFLYLLDLYGTGRKDVMLRKTVLSLYFIAVGKTDFEGYLNAAASVYTEPYYDAVNRFLLEQMKEDFSELKAGFLRVGTQCETALLYKFKAHADDYLDDIDRLAETESLREAGEIFAKRHVIPREKIAEDDFKLLDLKRRLTALKESYTGLVKKYREMQFDRETDLPRYLSCRRQTEALCALTAEFEAEYARMKREEGKVDFNDLERFSLIVLRDDKICAEVRAKYRYVFADEYQDINDVQEEILAAVSDGNLFMVGDVKQSIYGFRGCNPEIFRHKITEMEGRNAVLRLNYNFRSSDAVIAAVNAVFDHVMTEKTFGESYRKKSRLVSGGMFGTETGECVVHYYERVKPERTEQTPKVYSVLEALSASEQTDDFAEGKLVAKIIGDLLEKEYFDAKAGVRKKYTYGDIVILTRSKTSFADALVRQLLALGIPVSAEIKTDITAFPEIKQLIDLLKLLDCFEQDLPLVSVLKSRVGGFSNEDLAEIAAGCPGAESFSQAYGRALTEAAEPLRKRLNDFHAAFSELRFLAGFLPAGELLDRILSSYGIDLELLSLPMGEQRLKRVERFLEESRPNGNALTVRAFLSRVEGITDGFTVTEASGGNTVRLMSIHASKGLEFPAVILAGTDRPFNFKDASGAVLFDRTLGFAVKWYDDEKKISGETPFRYLLRERIKREAVKEEARIFYVALTRAQYALHIVAGGERRTEDPDEFEVLNARSYKNFLPASLREELYSAAALEADWERREIRRVLVGKPRAGLSERLRENLSFCYPYQAETALSVKKSVTESLRDEDDPYQLPAVFSEEAAEAGTAAHRFLEHYDFSAADPRAERDRMLGAGLLTEEDAAKLDFSALGKILSHPVFGELSSYRLYREKRFVFRCPARLLERTESEEGILLQGAIDLLAVKGNRGIIVDYKYSSSDAAHLSERYGRQLNLYRYAAEHSLPVVIDRLILISLKRGEVIELDLNRLDQP